jgi:hypothetical protein
VPANVLAESPFPVRGVSAGWVDRWENDEMSEMRAKAEADQLRLLERQVILSDDRAYQ